MLAANLALITIPFQAEDDAVGKLDRLTKSAREMMPSMSSVWLPSMPDLSLPDLSDSAGRLLAQFNSFPQQVGETLPLLEQMGYEVTRSKLLGVFLQRSDCG
ncbi:hypothetical protein AS156_19125 [Bradyrhizobium macuxiense]|uniref:Uncharacterized protein n=1 Tax=Bradyrhizobium macuxiense TaxID=1755647 RepID=A0A120FIU6_9BRAD|nr:hypothetical protein AS156_19125 [Bradyrhizobium macuxiense]